MGSSHALTTCTDLYFRPKLLIISNFIVVIIPMLCEQLPASYGLLSGSFSLTTRSAAEPLGLARLPMCTSTTQADLSPIYLSQWLGQDTPAASRVNLFTWNSSYQVRCAELTLFSHVRTTTPSSLMSRCSPKSIVPAATSFCSSLPLNANINKQNVPANDALDVVNIKNPSKWRIEVW